jgi:hypothetical protein
MSEFSAFSAQKGMVLPALYVKNKNTRGMYDVTIKSSISLLLR